MLFPGHFSSREKDVWGKNRTVWSAAVNHLFPPLIVDTGKTLTERKYSIVMATLSLFSLRSERPHPVSSIKDADGSLSDDWTHVCVKGPTVFLCASERRWKYFHPWRAVIVLLRLSVLPCTKTSHEASLHNLKAIKFPSFARKKLFPFPEHKQKLNDDKNHKMATRSHL